MNKTTSVIIAVVAVVVIAGGAVLLFGNNDSGNTGNDTNTGTNEPAVFEENKEAGPGEVAATLTYTEQGFTPTQVTIPAGRALKIVNNSDDAIAPSSDNHPTHTLNPELNFPDIAPGQSASLVLNRTGTWGIHDHYDASNRATVIVE